jgi:nucleotide-binding universal stress UspA family protein
MSRAARRTGLALLAIAAAIGCASESIVQDRGKGGSDAELAVSKIAVVGFRAEPRAGAEPLRSDATALVSSYVASAFAARGVDTIPPSDVEQALGAAGGVSAVRQVADHFGADAVAIGTVYKFRDRSGEALGSVSPASVGFEVRVFTKDGRPVGPAKVFEHTQVALGENALTAAQYPGAGTRWMTAEELAHWGAGQIVKSLHVVPRGTP